MSGLGLFLRFGLSKPSTPPDAGGTGIASFNTGYPVYSRNTRNRFGWSFTVDANDISVTALRVWVGGTQTYTVTLWRDSTQELLSTVTVTGGGGDWAQAAITPVTLLSGATYIVVMGSSSSVQQWKVAGGDIAAGINWGAGVTFASGRYASNAGYPTYSQASVDGIPDIAFTTL